MSFLLGMCCTCLNHTRKRMQDITDFDTDGKKYIIKLQSLLNVKMKCSDGMKMCWPCIQSLRLAYEFQEMCLKSRSSLAKYMQDVKIEYVPDEKLEEEEELNEPFEPYYSYEYGRHTQIKSEPVNSNKVHRTINESEEIVIDKTCNFQCAHCNLMYYTKAELLEHLRIYNFEPHQLFTDDDIPIEVLEEEVVEEVSMNCVVCNRLFADQVELDRHLAQGHASTKFYMQNCASMYRKEEKAKQGNKIFLEFKDYGKKQNKLYKHTAEARKTIKTENESEDTEAIKTEPMEDYPDFLFADGAEESNYTSAIAYECKPCKLTFVTRKELGQHRKEQHEPKMYVCHSCPEQFTQKSTYYRHVKIAHSAPGEYVCAFCNKKFTEPYHLRDHITVHTGERKYKCDICNKAFTRTGTLVRHRNTHLNLTDTKKEGARRTPFLCSICGIMLTFAKSASRHMRMHLGIKPYECTVCKKRFIQSTYLSRHMRVHTGEKQFCCSECGATYNQVRTFQKHCLTHQGVGIE